MRAVKMVVCVLLLALLAGGWASFLGARGEVSSEYDNYIADAEKSREKGLYAQAVEQFKLADSIKANVGVWKSIRDVYEKYAAEIPASAVKKAYVSDMLTAAAKYTEETEFYLSALLVQMESGDYRAAKRTSELALKNNAANDEIERISKQLKYMTRLDYKGWASVSPESNGRYVASDGAVSVIIDGAGEEKSERFEFIGAVGASGHAAVLTERGFRLIDAGGVERAVLPEGIEEAGVYNEETMLLPLMTGGKWRYFSVEDERFRPGEYAAAGTFVNGRAAVLSGWKWTLIDASGETAEELPFEEIKLKSGGEYIRSGIIIAREGGTWGLFDGKYRRIGELAADDIDAYLGGYIAFAQKGKWGFADANGNVVKEPEYFGARSFSNGLAAVKNADGLWGFVNDAFELVIPYEYLDADYFSAGGTCYVSAEPGVYRRLGFLLD
jgi:hypothetical protein